ncbi:hypothetical protein DV737_g4281, partial [Chaetothyriales sp. CBS 132003]
MTDQFSSCTADDYSAERAFTEAVRVYTLQLTKDPKKAKILDDIRTSSISDVVSTVNKARECYEKKRSDSRVKNCLVEVSRRLVYYGKVMDVMVQHHPDFAEQRDMHEKLRALQHGTALAFPNIQALQQETQVAVSTFRDSTMFTLSNVEKRQDQVSKDLASITLKVQQLHEIMICGQAVNADARIQLRNTMSESQLTQALGIVSSSLSLDHVAILQQSMQLRDKWRVKRDQYATVLQRSSSFKNWNSSANSGSINLKSTFKDRNLLSGSLTLIIEHLRQPRIAVLWVLKCRTQTYDATEILKSLIHQALTLDFVSHADVRFSFELRRYLDARSDDDYVRILGELLSHFKLVYIIVQVEAMLPEAACRFQQYLNYLLDKFEMYAPGDTLKILVASSGPSASHLQSLDRQLLRIRDPVTPEHQVCWWEWSSVTVAGFVFAVVALRYVLDVPPVLVLLNVLLGFLRAFVTIQVFGASGVLATCQFALRSVTAWRVITEAMVAPTIPSKQSSWILSILLAAVGAAMAIIQRHASRQSPGSWMKKLHPWIPNMSLVGLGMTVPGSTVTITIAMTAMASLIWQRRWQQSYTARYGYSVASGGISGEGMGYVVLSILQIASVGGSRYGSMFNPILTNDAPAPLPQFSQAVTFNGTVYCSGNIGIQPGTGFQLVKGTPKDRARQALTNLQAVLKAAGSGLEHVVKMNIYLTNMDNFTQVNEAYDEFFKQDKKPVSTLAAAISTPTVDSRI